MVEMITEACMLYPAWTPDYILQMPAPRFYSLFKAGKEYRVKKNAEQDLRLLDVVATTGIATKEYHEELRHVLRCILVGRPELIDKNKKVLRSEDPHTARVLHDLFAQAGKVNG